VNDPYNLDPPAGLEHLEFELRCRMSDGNAYALIAEVVAWNAKALATARDEALTQCLKVASDDILCPSRVREKIRAMKSPARKEGGGS
jgi:hypothetical protein